MVLTEYSPMRLYSGFYGILDISTNIRIGIYLTVSNESLHHGMQFKAISGGGEGTEFEKLKLEVKNNRAWEKISLFL